MSADPADETFIEVRGLTKRFGGERQFPFGRSPVVHAVENVSLFVRRGETFAIVGELGCGKSTLARLILRLIAADAGTVTFDGVDVTAAQGEDLRRLRRDMQMIFQDPFSSLNPRMTVGALVGEPLLVHGLADGADRSRRVAEILRLVGLPAEHAGRYPHEFSGGQRQRIGIARALATKPKLVIGDEPVSALDVSIRAQVINLLEDLKAQLGLTLILVAHDLAVIRHTSDRIAVMYLGEIVELANRDDLFDAPRHPYTRSLIAAIPVPVPGRRTARQLLEGDPPSPTAPPPGCRFHTRCPFAEEQCRRERPALRAIETGHHVACHLAERLPAAEPVPVIDAEDDARRKRIALFAAAQARTTQSPSP